ncbi:MAG: CDP-diacylglycerol--glycerol-3-phosphate 3-phosphatidyltransferase [Eubacterium sp.]|jgi:CDP-diacylglycerol--glycerol-3-phosphate 3-phosphatidyltransferase|nr:CDP-diacylglycerol--glycerol-3-phosphate 3-phosphatidyltransferase [Eubacterium sp.]MBR6217429.1 CDP-diacylglycerol--glycerol-3-phosphate 3-phosphatidyltransferase [Eubacterium sp.]HBE10397.1 CDP-diacylglycerol--glycerol-3-phosphate 3-phosphatidyltransferase [Lachnospiraceae bacterium]
MNLPNKITTFRAILVPFFVFFMVFDKIPGNKWYALALFIIASFSDLVDGKLARKYNLVTDFGKFMDPLADKLLVCSAMIALCGLGRLYSVVVIIMIGREFIISGFRLIAADNGRVIAASMWGKVKTVMQMIMVCFLIADLGSEFTGTVHDAIGILEAVLVVVSTLLAIVSLLDYISKNKDVISTSK